MNSYKLLFVSFLSILTASLFGQQVVVAEALSVSGTVQCNLSASAKDASGNVLLTGKAGSQVFTQKLTASGVLVFSNLFSDPPLTSCTPQFIASNSSGVSFVAGTLSDPDTASTGIFIIAIKSNGVTAWSVKDFAHYNVDGLAVAGDGNPVLALERQLNSNPGIRNFDLVKYSSSTGAVGWKTLQSYDPQGTSCSALASDGHGHLYSAVYRSSSNLHSLISFKEATGTNLWAKQIGTYAPITSLTPRFLSVLPSGDALICSDGTNQVWGVANVDRVRAADGAFVFRKYVGQTSGTDRYVMSNSPVADASNNLYLGITYFNGKTLTTGGYGGKMSSTGVLDFLTSLPGTSTRSGWQAAAVGPNGGVYVATQLLSGSVVNLLSSAGKVVWTKTEPNLYASSGFSASSNASAFANVLVAANGYDTVGNGVYQVLNLTSSGAVAFDYRSSRTGYVNGAFQQSVTDAAGNIYLAGYQGLFIYVSKYSPAGALLWNHQVTPSSSAWIGNVSDLTWSPRGELVVAGTINGADPNSLSELGLIKVNANTGAQIWARDYSSGLLRYNGYFVREDASGNVFVAGYAQTLSGVDEGIVTKFAAATGLSVWQKVDPAAPYFGAMVVDSKGSVIVGTADYGTRGGNYKATKFSGSGAPVFSHLTPTSNTVGYSALSVDPADNVFESCADVDSVQILKLGPTGSVGYLKKLPVTATFVEDCESIYDPIHGALYVMSNGHDSQNGEMTSTLRVNPLTGAQTWISTYSRGQIPYGTQGPTYPYWCVDKLGNVFLSGIRPKATQQPSDIAVRKLAASTGTAMWTYTLAGKYATSENELMGLIVGPDNEPVIFGTTPSVYGPDDTQACFFKVKG